MGIREIVREIECITCNRIMIYPIALNKKDAMCSKCIKTESALRGVAKREHRLE